VVPVYAADTGESVHEAPCTPATTCLAFSPDGRWLVSTNWDGSLNLWNGGPSGEHTQVEIEKHRDQTVGDRGH
jgi:WD40 repeat protein